MPLRNDFTVELDAACSPGTDALQWQRWDRKVREWQKTYPGAFGLRVSASLRSYLMSTPTMRCMSSTGARAIGRPLRGQCAVELCRPLPVVRPARPTRPSSSLGLRRSAPASATLPMDDPRMSLDIDRFDHPASHPHLRPGLTRRNGYKSDDRAYYIVIWSIAPINGIMAFSN